MIEIILKLIEQLNSSVFILLGLLFVAFYAIYKIGGMVSKFGNFEKDREKTSNSLDNIKDNVAKINATVDLLYKAHLATIQSRSPVSLSDLGKKISDDLKLEIKVNDHWQQIKNEIMKNSPSNPYDIQVITLRVAQDCFDKFFIEKEKDEIKLYAYKIGMDLMQIYPIIGIISRDRILKEMNISIDDIDNHFPKK